MDRSNCLNCGATLTDRYCASCGQREITDADRGLGHLIGDFFTELTSLESRTWRSFVALLFRPGLLSRTYLSGARQRYLKPISLFLIANLLFFLAPPLTDLSLPLRNQALQPWAEMIRPLVESKAALRAGNGETDARGDVYDDRPTPGYVALQRDYDARSGEISKLLVIAHIPFLAFGLMLAFAFRRFWYAEHVVVALHVFAATMLMAILVHLVLRSAHALGHSFRETELLVLRIGLQLSILAHFAMTVRHAYGIGGWRTLLATACGFVAFSLGHFVYRLTQALIVLSLI